MINRDPLDEICEDILRLATYSVRILEIRIYFTVMRTKFAAESILSKIVYCAQIAWSYVEERLMLCGILPYPTAEEVAASCEQLRLKIAETQYDDHPGVLASKKQAQAVLDAYDKRKAS